MKTVLRTLATLAVLGTVAGAAIVGFGLYNVSARVGHLPGVSWVLHTTFRQSVKLRAPPASEVPDLSDPAFAALGASHFDGACRMCHASPGELRSATARAMLPAPPHVTDAIEDWQPRHLAWILHEGIKMSGMPAWPADREDEVWPVVAFLLRVEGMSAGDYAALIAPPQGADDPAFAYCATCHGTDGVGRMAPHVPRLDILDRAYMGDALVAYREMRRESGIMRHAATALQPEALARVLDRYAAMPPGEAGPSPDPALASRGADLAAAATGDPDVPACRACHGPDATERAAGMPSIQGQHAAYLATQLRLWRDGERGGGPRANLMHAVANDLTDDAIAALAAYYASLPPSR